MYNRQRCSLLTVTFTVKTLYMGGYEIEFPQADFLPKMKALLQERYPTANWYVSSCRDEANLPVTKVKGKTQTILVQLGNAKVRERKMWINGEADVLKQWLKELNQIHATDAAAAESVHIKPASPGNASIHSSASHPQWCSWAEMRKKAGPPLFPLWERVWTYQERSNKKFRFLEAERLH